MDLPQREFSEAGTPWRRSKAVAAVGVTFLVLYVATLARGVYPGVSAGWTASALGVQPWASAQYPLWRMCAALWLKLPFGDAVWRLNLSSAVYATATAVLLCWYVSRWVYARLRPDEMTAGRKKATLVSVMAGVVAAVLFGTSLAGWSAATRFRPEAFDLMLILFAFTLYQDYLLRHKKLRLYALALLCGVGVPESAMFLILTPIFILGMLVVLNQQHRLRWRMILGLMVTGLSGAMLYVVAARQFALATSAVSGTPADWPSVLQQVLRSQFAELRNFMPAVGWPFVLLLLVIPWMAFQAGYWERLHRSRDYRADGLLFLLAISVVLLQFNTPIPPWPYWLRMERLPVLETAFLAMLGGWTFAYWLYGCLVKWDPDVIGSAKSRPLLASFERLKRRQSVVVSVCLVVSVIWAAFCNGLRANGQRGLFADQCAQAILDQLGARSWVVTDGTLDTHLAVLAAAQGRTVRLMNLGTDRDAAQIHRLRRNVEEDPRLQPYRARLMNAATLGVSAFVREWLAADPEANAALALYGVPDFLSEAGLTVCPDRFLFLAVRSPAGLRSQPFLDEHRMFWNRMCGLLPLSRNEPDPADRLRHLLRRHLSLVANDLGVLLIDLGRSEEAFDAFDEALVLEPDNLSAKLNRMLLAKEGVFPERQAEAEATAKKAMAAFKRQPSMFEVVRAYGQLHSAEALASVGVAWMRLGQYGLAQAAMARAAALAKDDDHRAAIQASLGGVRLTMRDTKRSETVFRKLIETQPDNPYAMFGMLDLALLKGDTALARDWLAKARAVRADGTVLVLTEARIEIAERNYEACYARLVDLTDRAPQNIDAWTLLAAVMIQQGRLDEVERQVLPKMEKIVHQAGNPMILQVRGAVARAKGPASYAAARDAYRGALGALPGRRDLLEIVLDLDLAMNDVASASKDACDLLRVDRNHPRAHFVLGTQAVARGDMEAGEWHLRNSVMEGGDAASWNNLADLLQRRGVLDEAETAARQAVALSDKSVPLLDTLAAVLLERGKADEAKAVITRARTLAPEDWQVAFTEARILMRCGQTEEARILLRQVQGHLDDLPSPVRAEVARVVQEWRSKR